MPDYLIQRGLRRGQTVTATSFEAAVAAVLAEGEARRISARRLATPPGGGPPVPVNCFVVAYPDGTEYFVPVTEPGANADCDRHRTARAAEMIETYRQIPDMLFQRTG